MTELSSWNRNFEALIMGGPKPSNKGAEPNVTIELPEGRKSRKTGLKGPAWENGHILVDHVISLQRAGLNFPLIFSVYSVLIKRSCSFYYYRLWYWYFSHFRKTLMIPPWNVVVTLSNHCLDGFHTHHGVYYWRMFPNSENRQRMTCYLILLVASPC